MQFDRLELWVADIAVVQRTLTSRFGFAFIESPFPDCVDEESAHLRCGGVDLVIRQGLSGANPIARHVARHGDGVGDVGFVSRDAGAVIDAARARGLNVLERDDDHQIDVLGDGTILHSIREAEGRVEGPPRGPYFRPMDPETRCTVDHVTYCLPWGAMDRVTETYSEVFGFHRIEIPDCARVGDDATGMRSVVLRSSPGSTLVLTEPINATSAGQTQRFIHGHAGAGVQHVAIAYDDLVAAVGRLRANGAAFLAIPEPHLERSHARFRDRALPWDALRRHQIMVDADDDGLLFQLFTMPITVHGGFFLELVQRDGATTFGAANVRGLFAAVDAAMSAGRSELA